MSNLLLTSKILTFLTRNKKEHFFKNFQFPFTTGQEIQLDNNYDDISNETHINSIFTTLIVQEKKEKEAITIMVIALWLTILPLLPVYLVV